MTISRRMLVSVSAATILCASVSGSLAQPAPDPGAPPLPFLDEMVVQYGPESAGRGAPLQPIPPQETAVVGPEMKGLLGGAGVPPRDGRAILAAENGDIPEGVTPLETDVFYSTDYYADRDLWTDPRYWRCASPHGMEQAWGTFEAPHIGDNFPETVAWGYCDRDYPVENIVSPYPYTTASEHYAALLAEAESRGGPTNYTYENPPPNWSGRYANTWNGSIAALRSWISGYWNQIPTIMSLLTPEYQDYYAQQMYWYAHGQGITTAQFCWPDGYMYRWFGSNPLQNLIVTPDLVQMRSGNEQMVIEAMVGAEFLTDREVPYISSPNEQTAWGEAIGFWDGEIFVMMSSNIKQSLAHGLFESSDHLQTIEIFTPIEDQDGNFVGIQWEAILYDDQAFVQPLRTVIHLRRNATYEDATPALWRQCAPAQFMIDGQQTLVPPGTTIEYTVPDMSGRPWGDIWYELEEAAGMSGPEEEEVNVLEGFL